MHGISIVNSISYIHFIFLWFQLSILEGSNFNHLDNQQGGSEALLEKVEEKMETLGMQLNINITIIEVERFGKKRYSNTENN